MLLLGLLVSWLRDLVTTRTLRLGTVLLILLTGLNLYQYWQRRQARRRAPSGSEEPVSRADQEPLSA